MKILIVGLGVIGGGYAMSLKEAGYNEVYGIDTNEETLKKAKEMKIIKEGFTREDEIISEMNLIILAIYPNLVKDFIVKNKNKFKENALITDVTGIKQLFINDIVEILPQNIDFVFAHPMAGRENKGIDYATNKVFQGANFLIVETKKNKEENIRKIENLAKEMGFKHIKRTTPAFHDEMIAFTSQLPHVLAVALTDSYRDLTRIANMNEKLWSLLFLGNKKNLLEAMNNFEAEFDKIKKCIEENDEKNLQKLFIKSTIRREQL